MKIVSIYMFCTRLCTFYATRLSGRFASIFYLNCEHFLFVYNVKQKQKRGFFKISWISKLEIECWRIILKFESSINLPWGHVKYHKQNWAQSGHTNKETSDRTYKQRHVRSDIQTRNVRSDIQTKKRQIGHTNKETSDRT